jgi:hypothetical protein
VFLPKAPDFVRYCEVANRLAGGRKEQEMDGGDPIVIIGCFVLCLN